MSQLYSSSILWQIDKRAHTGPSVDRSIDLVPGLVVLICQIIARFLSPVLLTKICDRQQVRRLYVPYIKPCAR